MLKTTSQEFRKFFLLEFTKELIKNTAPKEIIRIKTQLQNQKDKEESEIKKALKEKEELKKKKELEELVPMKTKKTIEIGQKLPLKKRFFKPLTKPLVSQIRMQRLPQRLQYLRPIAKDLRINLGKLNQLIKDPSIISIECNGSNKKIIVNSPRPRTTEIALTKEDINQIVEEFSDLSRIPIQKGIYKVAAGRLILLAAISEIIDTKFIIKRIPTQKLFQR